MDECIYIHPFILMDLHSNGVYFPPSSKHEAPLSLQEVGAWDVDGVVLHQRQVGPDAFSRSEERRQLLHQVPAPCKLQTGTRPVSTGTLRGGEGSGSAWARLTSSRVKLAWTSGVLQGPQPKVWAETRGSSSRRTSEADMAGGGVKAALEERGCFRSSPLTHSIRLPQKKSLFYVNLRITCKMLKVLAVELVPVRLSEGQQVKSSDFNLYFVCHADVFHKMKIEIWWFEQVIDSMWSSFIFSPAASFQNFSVVAIPNVLTQRF